MPERQSAQTASQENSIWKTLPEDTFRRSIIALRAKNEVPCEQRRWWSASYSRLQLSAPSSSRTMSLNTENQLANDFAFIAAAKPGPRGVTAACVEETSEPPGLIIRIAANEGVSMETREALVQICKCLMACARDGESTVAFSCTILMLWQKQVLTMAFQKYHD